MGVDHSAKLVYGVYRDEIYTVTKSSRTETRYDEKTGKPYQKSVPCEVYTLFGKDADECDAAKLDGSWDDIAPNLGLEKLEEFYPDCYNGVDDDAVIGLAILDLDPGEMDNIPLDHMNSVVSKVDKALAEAGCEAQPELFLLCVVS